MSDQPAAISAKIKAGKVKNIYAAKAKIKKIRKARVLLDWLGR